MTTVSGSDNLTHPLKKLSLGMSFLYIFIEMSFKENIYAVVKKIPKSKVLTYKELATRVGKPKAFRAVGNI